MTIQEVVPAVVAPLSFWTPAMVGTVVGSVATLITAVATASVLIIKEIRTARTQGAEAGAARDEKLGRIEVLVDGRYSQVLKELANVKQLLAMATGGRVDAAEAVIAQDNSDKQEARLHEAGGPIAGVK